MSLPPAAATRLPSPTAMAAKATGAPHKTLAAQAMAQAGAAAEEVCARRKVRKDDYYGYSVHCKVLVGRRLTRDTLLACRVPPPACRDQTDQRCLYQQRAEWPLPSGGAAACADCRRDIFCRYMYMVYYMLLNLYIQCIPYMYLIHTGLMYSIAGLVDSS